MKFAICAVLKNENLYLREWVKYHIDLGFDKIILYDNNNVYGEKPQAVIEDYIDKGFVDIYDARGKNIWYVHPACYNEAIERYKDEYEWMACIDIDEFITLEKHTKIQYLFESMPEYNDYDAILLSWKVLGDKDAIYYENDLVQNRFKQEIYGPYDTIEDINCIVKSIVHTNKKNVFVTGNPHITMAENICNADGYKCYADETVSALNRANHRVMYLRHYYTKSLSEYLYKTSNQYTYMRDIDAYKRLCGWSEEHEKVYQNFLKSCEYLK